jgi:hypothetical protein
MIGDKIINEEFDFHAHILMNVVHGGLFVFKGIVIDLFSVHFAFVQ